MHRLAWTAIAFLIVSTGCEDEDDAGIDAIDFAQREREALCELRVRCGLSIDRDRCLTAFERDRDVLQAIGGIEAQRVNYDPAAAAAYIELIEQLGCESTLENQRAIETGFEMAIEGLVAPGEPCFADSECAGERALCDQTGCGGGQLCCEGTCTVIETLPLGAACPLVATELDRITAFCEDTAYCAPPNDDDADPPIIGTCQPRVSNGEPCDRDEACLDGQRCAMGQCFMLAGTGQPCNAALEVDACLDLQQVCDPETSSCSDAPGDGEPCSRGVCSPYASCIEDTCVRRPNLGESCENTPPCQGDLQCRDGACEDDPVAFVCLDGNPPPPPEGE